VAEASDIAELHEAPAAVAPADAPPRRSVTKVNRELDAVLSWLRSVKPQLDITDDELLELFWAAHPRFQFFSSLNWGTNLIDLGAGNGGLGHWKNWVTPARRDLNLYGVDRTIGEHRALYADWEAIDLDREMPGFSGVRLTGFIASHLIEQLATPERLIEWIGARAEPGTRVYLEWPSPTAIALPSRDELRRHDFDVLISNFRDDPDNRNCPDLATMRGWLNDAGLTTVASGAVDLGLLGEELFARAADRRSMGYWSMMQFSLYAVAVKPGVAADVVTESVMPSREPPVDAPPAADAPANEERRDAGEITASFIDRSEWRRFSETRPHLTDPAYAASIIEQAKTDGVSSAFLGDIPVVDVTAGEGDVLAKGLSARERAVLELIAAEPWCGEPTTTIYATEAMTPFALVMRGRYTRFIGSEHATDEAARDALFPIPLQDPANLTFPSDRFDCVVTNNRLQQAPDSGACLREMCRVLRRGGVMLATFAFNPAEAGGGSPGSEALGWDILDRARQAGFSRAEMVFVSGRRRAITASEIAGVFVLRCYK
jgi:SAM-dependent methyltransferase